MIDFSSLPLTSFIGKILRGILSVIPANISLPVLQGPLRGKMWIKGSGVNGYWLGSFESKKVAQFVKELEPGHVVYDIGANVGYYTLLSSIAVGDQGKVYAFEPLPENVDYLRRHIENNKVNNVKVLEVAVSGSSGTAFFEEGPNRFMGSLSPEGTVEVETVALDTFCTQQEMRLPDIIKIDVEGAEYDVLQGAVQIIRANMPVIYLATHEKNKPGVHQQCIRFLAALGYSVQSLDSDLEVEKSTELIARCG